MNSFLEKKIFTIITPTYNRAHTIQRVFDSLMLQTFDAFEWIVVDDGSTDNTKALMENYEKKASFPIKYFYKENGGKHRAVNFALDFSEGELTIIADSDDEFIPETLEVFDKVWSMHNHNRLCGMKSYVKNHRGKVYSKNIGNSPIMVNKNRYHEIENNFSGEGWFCILTSVMKENKFKEFNSEPFMPESTVWNRILEKYNIIYLPMALRIYYDNEPDSLCKSNFGQIKKINSPNGYLCYLLDTYRLTNKTDFIKKSKILVNMSRYFFHSQIKKKKLCINLPVKFYFLMCFFFPVGYVFYKYDRYKLGLTS